MRGSSAALAALAWVSCFATQAAETTPPSSDLRAFIPQSVSPEARSIYQKLLPVVEPRWDQHHNPVTAADFQKLHDDAIARTMATQPAMLAALKVTVNEMQLDGVGVVETTPPDYRDDGTVIVHLHGGGFYLDSARSSVGMDARLALVTGRRFISVDYTVAPKGNWRIVTDQVVAVYKALLEQGYKPKSIGMLGDSAGGNIVSASVLKLRDEGLPIPGALVLFSPCVDFNQAGDTNRTLRAADPAIDEIDIVPGLEAYAPRTDWNNPYVSPIFGDFKKGFPPTLIQAGTKEVLLSDSVRLYQAIKTSGGAAELDLYEGMAHVFQAYMTGTPEQKAAFAEVKRFWSKHLVPAKHK